jgi:glutathione synthase/RimK-type ligase-like ATP-grasp enzyme
MSDVSATCRFIFPTKGRWSMFEDKNAASVDPTARYEMAGVAVMLERVFTGGDLTQLGQWLIEYTRVHDDPRALLDLALVLESKDQPDAALSVQRLALQSQRLYRLHTQSDHASAARVLVLKAPGRLVANTPFEFLVKDSTLNIDVLYADDWTPDDCLPEHDMVLVAAGALHSNRGALAKIASLVASSSRPVLNRPANVWLTTREAATQLLAREPGVCMADIVRLDQDSLIDALESEDDFKSLVGVDFPLIVRPVDSHAGRSLVRVIDREALRSYLADVNDDNFYLASFIDYRSPDGLYRKYRIVLLNGVAYACHMGISQDWMVHYPYEEMTSDARRREEEARFMETFEHDFAVRHHAALAGVARLTGLEYVGLDCGETADGRLLIFEISTAMLVHDMDSREIFPYKQSQMQRIFRAFNEMLVSAAQSAESVHRLTD